MRPRQSVPASQNAVAAFIPFMSRCGNIPTCSVPLSRRRAVSDGRRHHRSRLEDRSRHDKPLWPIDPRVTSGECALFVASVLRKRRPEAGKRPRARPAGQRNARRTVRPDVRASASRKRRRERRRSMRIKAEIYARVSTLDQKLENQLADVCRYREARGWTSCRRLARVPVAVAPHQIARGIHQVIV